MIEGYDHNWSVVGNRSTLFFLTADEGAERDRIVTVDLIANERRFIDFVPERTDATLSEAALLGGPLLVTYLVDAKTEMRRYRLDGAPDGTIALPGIGTAGGLKGRPDDDDLPP